MPTFWTLLSHVNNMYSAIESLQYGIKMSATTSLVQSAVQIKFKRRRVLMKKALVIALMILALVIAAQLIARLQL